MELTESFDGSSKTISDKSWGTLDLRLLVFRTPLVVKYNCDDENEYLTLELTDSLIETLKQYSINHVDTLDLRTSV